jgi:N-glycosidase YbiA
MSRKIINFYSTREAYGEFSNFAAFPIEMNGRIWPTSEHYFQAQKFAGTEHEEIIRTTASPMTAAKIGRDRSRPLRADWDEVKDFIMRDALRAKFNQHPRLATRLLETGDAEIVEHTVNDAYWGDGGDGSGLNRLGQVLMEVRTELRKAAD